MTASEREIAPNIAALAALIGEPARAAMLWSLMGGQSRPASELARIAGISPQAASAHLARMTEGGFLHVESKGRHRFFRLAGAEAATTIESLAAMATATGADKRVVSLVPRPLRQARRCWGHLAGEIGVQLHDLLIDNGWIVTEAGAYTATDIGRREIEQLGVDIDRLRRSPRGLVFACLDWSERRPHLGGPLACALLDAFLARGWLANGRLNRQLRVTPAGDRAFDALRRGKIERFAKTRQGKS
jgi:DNA-binding transcriptional ArsR family regulator